MASLTPQTLQAVLDNAIISAFGSVGWGTLPFSVTDIHKPSRSCTVRLDAANEGRFRTALTLMSAWRFHVLGTRPVVVAADDDSDSALLPVRTSAPAEDAAPLDFVFD